MKTGQVQLIAQNPSQPTNSYTTLSQAELEDEGYLAEFTPTDLLTVMVSNTNVTVTAATAQVIAAEISGAKVNSTKPMNREELTAFLEQTSFDDYGTISANEVASLVNLFDASDSFFVSEWSVNSPDTFGIVITPVVQNDKVLSASVITGRYE